jgi:hypothetical protein
MQNGRDADQSWRKVTMPILECDPWREQYFERVPCPPEVIVPTDDPESWRLFPAHRWVFNKLAICTTQGLEHGPHGVPPTRYPVFSKPIYNLKGMGIGSRLIRSAEEYHQALTPGHLWMTLLEGEHLSSDAAVIDGRPSWWRHARGVSIGEGTFDYWTVFAAARPALEHQLGAWLSRHLRGYTGMVNLETIGGRIIECHLRFADQWPDLHGGDAWVGAVVALHVCGEWRYDDRDRREGFSVVLWGPHGPRYRHPPRELIDALLSRSAISSVQITFHADRAAEEHAMPPGGFRLAVINCWELAAGFAAREELRAAILGQHY